MTHLPRTDPRRRTVHAVLACSLPLLLALGLSGCSDSDDPSEAAASSSPHADDDTLTIDDPNLTTGDELPEGFPSEVPLVEGRVTSGTHVDGSRGTTWMVALTAERDVEAVTAEVQDDYAAWTERLDESSEGGYTLGVENEQWSVTVVVLPASGTAGPSGTSTVTYTVAPAV